MAEIIDEVETYPGAILGVLEAVRRPLDGRKVFWCNYPVLNLELDDLEERVKKDTRKLEKEVGDDLHPEKLWYVGIPQFRLVRRGIAHLRCEIDLYYVAHQGFDDWCWYGKLVPKADRFEIPLRLIDPLVEALSQGELEAKDAKAVERVRGYTVYDYLGREWKVPDAFLGFVWALREKGKGFDDLLDPTSCSLMDRFARELPSPENPRLTIGSYEEIVSGLRSLGWNKADAEERAKYITQKYGDAALEEKMKHALND